MAEFSQSHTIAATVRGAALRRRMVAAFIALVVSAVCGTTAAAQSDVIAGVVTQQGGAPIPNVQVTIKGTRLGAITDASGRFRITGVTGPTATVEARRIGYRLTTVRATSGDQSVRVTLPIATVSLDAVVVTGQPGFTDKRTLGVDVAQIDATSAVQRGPVRDVQQLLNGRAAGVTILQNSGVVGSGATVRIRGVSSFSLSNQPLIYVDGVRVDNAQGTGPTNQGFGASTTSRWNDFSPDDIETIEIVRGPAASTLYGTEAANGVIQIITKKGSQGKPTWEFSTRQGVNQFANPEGRLFTNYSRDAAGAIQSLDIVDRESTNGTPIFRKGRMQSYDLGVGGGSPLFRYRISGNFQRDEGAEATNQLKNTGTRANLSVFPSDRVSVVASLNFVQARTDLPFEAGGGGLTWGTYFSSPSFLDYREGWRTAPPSMYHKEYQSYQDVGRFTGSVELNHHPSHWFSQRAVIGTDRGNEYSEELASVHPDLINFFGDDAGLGYKAVDTRDNSLSTVNYSATVIGSLGRHLSSSSSFGADFYRRHTRFVSAYGEVFPAPGLTAISSTTANRTGSENQVQNNTVGVFGQQQFGWNDRLFLTAGLRVDNNSSFGANFSRVYYPKFSGAWVVSEEPFFHLGGINTLKLRAAYGQTGQAPTPYSAVPTFTAVPGPGGSAAVTPLSRGNPNLGPERGYETELGLDAGFLGDRAGIEFTYFTGGTKDAILAREVPPSSGYPGSQLINAGRLSKRGMEFVLRGTPLQTSRAGLDMSFTAATNKSTVENLGGADFIVPSRYIQHRVGFPVGAWFEKKVVDATLDANGKVLAVMCDGGPGANNAPVPCGSAPNVFLGRTTPNFEGAFSSNLRVFSNLSFYALVDFKRGYSKLDGNRRVRCHIFIQCRENYYPLEFSPAIVGAVSSSNYISDLIQDASFTKLREVSVSYNLPGAWVSRLGSSGGSISLAGRNLHTWTKYKGLEPEASFQGGSRGFGQWEQNVTPQLRSFVTSLRLTF